MRIAVLASGSGTNLQAFIDKKKAGLLDVEICLVASNNPDAKALQRAKDAGIPTWAKSHKDYSCREDFDLKMAEIIRQHNADLVVLAGYMRILSSPFLELFKNRVINIHPALLPSFPGVHGAKDAQEYGVKVTGCTVHFVEEKMDSGPVIIQAVVPALAGEKEEELLQRIHVMEHRIYPQAVQWLATKRIDLDGRMVRLKPAPVLKIYPQINGELSSQWFVYPALEEGF